MEASLLAYAGPDQVMTVTSGIASIVGVLLIFWHQVVGFCSQAVNRFRGAPAAAPIETSDIPPKS